MVPWCGTHVGARRGVSNLFSFQKCMKTIDCSMVKLVKTACWIDIPENLKTTNQNSYTLGNYFLTRDRLEYGIDSFPFCAIYMARSEKAIQHTYVRTYVRIHVPEMIFSSSSSSLFSLFTHQNLSNLYIKYIKVETILFFLFKYS